VKKQWTNEIPLKYVIFF